MSTPSESVEVFFFQLFMISITSSSQTGLRSIIMIQIIKIIFREWYSLSCTLWPGGVFDKTNKNHQKFQQCFSFRLRLVTQLRQWKWPDIENRKVNQWIGLFFFFIVILSFTVTSRSAATRLIRAAEQEVPSLRSSPSCPPRHPFLHLPSIINLSQH